MKQAHSMTMIRYEDVKNDNTKTTWALFGYIPQSDKLQVVSTGTGGIQGFTDELNTGIVGYGINPGVNEIELLIHK